MTEYSLLLKKKIEYLFLVLLVFCSLTALYHRRPRLEIRKENSFSTNPLTKKVGIEKNVQYLQGCECLYFKVRQFPSG